MIEAVHLYWELRSRGIWLRVEGRRIDYTGPRDSVTVAVRDRLRRAKPALVRLFSEPCPCETCAALGEEPPAKRLYCASGLDCDATWESLRREFDALDEADERAAIQAVEGP